MSNKFSNIISAFALIVSLGSLMMSCRANNLSSTANTLTKEANELQLASNAPKMYVAAKSIEKDISNYTFNINVKNIGNRDAEDFRVVLNYIVKDHSKGSVITHNYYKYQDRSSILPPGDSQNFLYTDIVIVPPKQLTAFYVCISYTDSLLKVRGEDAAVFKVSEWENSVNIRDVSLSEAHSMSGSRICR